MARVTTATAAAASLALAACDLTLPWSEGARPGSRGSLAATPARLEFVARVGDDLSAPQAVEVRNRTGFEVGIEYDQAFFAFVRPLDAGFTAAPAYPDLLGPGIHTTEIWLWPCRAGPTGCQAAAGAVPLVIPVRYAVEPSLLAVTPSPITLEYVDFVNHDPSVTVTIDDPAGPGPWTAELGPATGTCPSANLFLSATEGNSLPAQLRVIASTFFMSEQGSCTRDLRVTRGRATVAAPVRYTARIPSLDGSPPRIELTGVAHQLPLAAPQALSVLFEGSAFPFAWVRPGPADWLEVRQTSSGLTVGVTRADLEPGSYSTTIEVQAPRADAPVTSIPVTYALAPTALRVAPFQWALTLLSTTQLGELLQVVSLADSGTPISWTATPSVPWLAVSPSAGVTAAGAQVTLSIPSDALPQLAFGPNAGEVVFRHSLPGGGAEQVAVQVSVRQEMPRLERLMPRTVAAGQGGRAATYGEWPTAFQLDGTWAMDAGVDGRLALWTIPALTAGSYPVVVPNGIGLSRSDAVLRVLAPVSREATAVVSPGRKTRLLFDDAAETLYAVNPGSGTVDRHRAAAGWGRESLAISGLHDASLSPDGASLVAAASGAVVVVDTGSWALADSQPASPALPEAGASDMDWRIAHAVDGMAVILRADADAGVYTFDGTTLTAAPGGGRGWGEPTATGDGARVYAVRADPSGLPILRYDAGGFLWAVGTFAGSHLASDRGGGYLLAVRDEAAAGTSASMLLDMRFGAPVSGTLPGTVANAVLSHDAARAVAWDPSAGKVRVFDLGGSPVSGYFPEIGEGIVPAGDPGAGGTMVLSVDDRTLFLAGDQRVVVVPLP